MTNKKAKLFPTQSDSEKIFYLIRRHWLIYVAFLLIALFMLLPLIAGFFYLVFFQVSLSQEVTIIITIISGIYLLFILGLMFYGFIDYYLDTYIITDSRIVSITQNGFFKREISELHLREVQDVNAKVRGLLPTFFHYGEVYIQTAGEAENFIFHSIPHPYRISKSIIDLHEKHLHGKNASKQLKEIDLNSELIEGLD